MPRLRPIASATPDLRVAAVLVVAAALRVWLIVSGGQFYWPDEGRYRGARVLLSALLGNRQALDDVLREPAALMFKAVGTLPAGIEALTGTNPHVPALFFGSTSIVTIWLLAAIARRLGASRDEQFLAALLGAGSAALFYMSRHLLSYDLALMFGLFGVYVGVRRPSTPFASVLTGLWSVASFFAYAGAWPLAGAVCAIHALDAQTVRDAVRRALLTVAGVVPVVVVTMLGYGAAGLSWVDLLRGFASDVTQGEFAEGWALPVAYLWHAEHVLLIVWAVAFAWCVWRFRVSVQTRLTRAGLTGAACVYVLLAASSTILHRFVVYGRLARPLVPFLCLITAALLGSVLIRFPEARRRIVLAVVVICVAAQAAYNFRIPLQQEYPAGFIARIEREYPGPHVFVNARHLYPGPEPVHVPPGYREVASARHPLQFLPYQYEGFTELERELLRTTDIRMRAYVPAQ